MTYSAYGCLSDEDRLYLLYDLLQCLKVDGCHILTERHNNKIDLTGKVTSWFSNLHLLLSSKLFQVKGL